MEHWPFDTNEATTDVYEYVFLKLLDWIDIFVSPNKNKCSRWKINICGEKMQKINNHRA